MKILYRYSDSNNNKGRPSYFSKEKCFISFLHKFREHEIFIIADNIVDNTYQYLCQYLDKAHIIRTYLNNSKSFLFCIDYAIQHFDNNTQIYLAEDDYLYTDNAATIIEEGLQIADYVSGYDHPDKYINHNTGGPNPFIENGGEDTKVLITEKCHWKITNSCCMTFATTVKIIKEDYNIYQHFCSNNIPNDFHMFITLKNNNKRKLVSCIPSVSTHCETLWLAPFINWENQLITPDYL